MFVSKCEHCVTDGKIHRKNNHVLFPQHFSQAKGGHLNTLDDALARGDAYLCMALGSLLNFMNISPANNTPWCKGCYKAHINKTFWTCLSKIFTPWLRE